MNRASLLPALLVAGLALSGCASTTSQAAQPAKPPTSASSSMAGMAGTSAMAMTGSASKPTATALMVCSDDIKGKVTPVLKLKASPATRDSFANELYTCTYSLPMGSLVLSVQHSSSKAAAGQYFDGLRTKLAPATTLDGLGERAYGTGTGIAVVIKDDETLEVDATGLPPVFGADQQKRTDLAYEIASDVLGCWTGDE